MCDNVKGWFWSVGKKNHPFAHTHNNNFLLASFIRSGGTLFEALR